jgi:hypothetical protein
MIARICAQIPSDGSPEPERETIVIVEEAEGSEKDKWSTAGIAVGVVAAVVIPLMVYLGWRVRAMKRMVNKIVDEVLCPRHSHASLTRYSPSACSVDYVCDHLACLLFIMLMMRTYILIGA